MLEKLKSYFSQKQPNEVMNQTQVTDQPTVSSEHSLQESFAANVEASEAFNQINQLTIDFPESTEIVIEQSVVPEPEVQVQPQIEAQTEAPTESLDDLLAKEESQYLFTDPRVVGWLSTAEQSQ